MASSDPLAVIRARVRAAQARASLDFVAEFAGPPPRDLAAKVKSVMPGAVAVEQVFKKDRRFQRIRIPGPDPRALGGASPFDLVEPLRTKLGALSVEPDLATDFFPESPPEALRAAMESADVLGCWVNDSQPKPPAADWALDAMRVRQAWRFSQDAGRPAEGEGIVIAQPDTGVTSHAELDDAFDRTRWADLLDGGDPWDPLAPDDPLDTPGHGTSTASVVISRSGGIVTGSAPKALLAPIRCIETVVRISQSRVARAIEHAADSGCHVVTMSLGGLWSRSLAVAVQRAIDANLIVLAAAGNCVRLVVWPARFDRCIAVAGSSFTDGTWKGSSRGSAVDVSAPAQHVWRANWANGAQATGAGEGTSYAVALTAGVAALWLAHHGRDRLIASLGQGERLQDRFSRLLRTTARVPAGWDRGDFGAGIVDALGLLQAGAFAPEASPEAAAVARAGTPLNADEGQATREALAELWGAEAAAAEPDLMDRHGLELLWLALERRRRPSLGAEAASGPAPSAALRKALAGARPAATAAEARGEPQAAMLPEDNGHRDPDAPVAGAGAPTAAAVAEAARPWRVAKSLLTLRAQVDARAPGRSKASDGTIGDPAHQSRDSDHNPWVVDDGVGVVTAMDITHDPAGGCDCEELALAIGAGRDPRVKYVIWNRRIMSASISPWTWRPYTGRNPHTRHLHISVLPEKTAYNSEAPWRSAPPPGGAQEAAARPGGTAGGRSMITIASVTKPAPAPAHEAMAEGAAATTAAPAPRNMTPGHGGDAAAEPSRSLKHLVAKGKSGPLARPRGSSAVESIIGPIDDRVRILDTELPPWRMICALRMRGPNGAGAIGTGWLAGPKTVITAGHCVFSNFFFGGWASAIEVSPGRNGPGSAIQSVTSTRFTSVDRWVAGEDADFDIGCIHLDQDIGTTVGWFAIEAFAPADLEGFLVNVAGYPGDRGGGQELYHDRDRVAGVTERRLFYEVDTFGGQSGGPVWIHEKEGAPPIVVGIHAYGVGGTPTSIPIPANSAPRIIPEVLEQIRVWVAQDGGG